LKVHRALHSAKLVYADDTRECCICNLCHAHKQQAKDDCCLVWLLLLHSSGIVDQS
jgi:hypothetical protein